MSTPASRHDRPTPLHQRSQSQNNTLAAIRIVPYTPPRPQEERTPSQASSHTYLPDEKQTISSSNSSNSSSNGRHTPWAGSQRKEDYLHYGGNLGSTLKGDTVSAMKATPGSWDESPRTPIAAPTTPSDITPTYTTASQTQQQQPRPLSRSRNIVAVHSDKTFSLVPHQPRSPPPPLPPPDASVAGSSTRSPDLSYSSRISSSPDRPSIDAWSDDRPSRLSSPPTTDTSTIIPDPSLSECTPSPVPARLIARKPVGTTTTTAATTTTGSASSSRMVGGLRKVEEPLDISHGQYSSAFSVEGSSLAPLPEFNVHRDDQDKTTVRELVPKASFASTQTTSTSSETTNYKVYGRSSPVQISSDNSVQSPSIHSNYEILGRSSPVVPFASSPPGSSGSEQNYILHGDPSPSPSILGSTPQPRERYSNESLLVPPLRPAKKKSHETFGYYKQRSRDNLQTRAGSVKSLKSTRSLSSVNEEAERPFSASPLVPNLGGPAARFITVGAESKESEQRQDAWPLSRDEGSSAGTGTRPLAQPPADRMIEVHSHQWSSQLSTVMSESEGGSDSGLSRSVSPLSVSMSGVSGHRRRSSTGWVSSRHSRQLPSISSLAGQQDEARLSSQSQSQSQSQSLAASEPIDRPRPAYSRNGPSGTPMVRNQDEHGDGLADLLEVVYQSSRSPMSGFFSNSNTSSRNLHSSASSRANSFNSAIIPAWAKVYYGSGEPRFMGAPSASTSDSGDSRPPSFVADKGAESSPYRDRFPLSMYTPWRRPREANVVPRSPVGQRPFTAPPSMEITPVPPSPEQGVLRTLKRKTSSIWSPHLRMDRRASRYSIWEPPRVSWSADSGILGKRNAQVVLFIVGFVFPFAWMIAALLPLPPHSKLLMLERADSSQSGLGMSTNANIAYDIRATGETRFESARWWRNLNRFMSVVGVLIIAAIITLAVVGTRQRWVTS